MMRDLQSLTLSICILCTMAGLIRLLTPSGGYKVVINGALMLYILATGMQMAHHADWPSFARQMRRWQESESIAVPDYSDYAAEIAANSVSSEIGETLRNGGILAEISVSGNECTVRLHTAKDLSSARALLEEQSETLHFHFEVQDHG